MEIPGWTGLKARIERRRAPLYEHWRRIAISSEVKTNLAHIERLQVQIDYLATRSAEARERLASTLQTAQEAGLLEAIEPADLAKASLLTEGIYPQTTLIEDVVVFEREKDKEEDMLT